MAMRQTRGISRFAVIDNQEIVVGRKKEKAASGHHKEHIIKYYYRRHTASSLNGAQRSTHRRNVFPQDVSAASHHIIKINITFHDFHTGQRCFSDLHAPRRCFRKNRGSHYTIYLYDVLACSFMHDRMYDIALPVIVFYMRFVRGFFT